MANLVIDIGNSRTKVAVFQDRELAHFDVLDELTTETIAHYLAGHNIVHSILSSVKQQVGPVEALLSENTRYTRFTAATPSGIQNHYKTPQTLGLDRLAGLIGAQALYPESSNLVIDAGTCITCDAHDEAGNYYGGSISPGLRMRFKAMHTFTGRLPLVEVNDDFDNWMGDTTETAMMAGVVQGLVNELTGFIELYNKKYTRLNVIITGGDAAFFDSHLKNSIFAHILQVRPHVVLIGLNEVIHQQQ